MPNNYPFKPRGIMKWHAFSALLSGEEQKDSAHTEEILDIELSQDKLEQLNQELLNAVANDSLLLIDYIEDNKVKQIKSRIIKIDYQANNIVFEDLTLSVLQIINLNIN